jgi:hypothetical protein
MKNLFLIFIFIVLPLAAAMAEDKNDIDPKDIASGAIFDDKAMLEGYIQRYTGVAKEDLVAMVADDSLGAYKCAAAVTVFKETYANQLLSKEKPAIIKILLRRLNRSDSPFVQVEIMHLLVIVDRYQYFENMVPALIQKMDHYNPVVSSMAYRDLLQITKDSIYTREARIVFETLRKILFLSRNRLQLVNVPDQKLRQKLQLLRWSVTILGTSELKRLPPEVINLL